MNGFDHVYTLAAHNLNKSIFIRNCIASCTSIQKQQQKNKTKRYETKTETLIPCSAFHHCRLIWIIQREFMEFHRSNETEIENELYCLRLRRQNKTHTNRLDGCSQRGRKREGMEKKANNYKWFFSFKKALVKEYFLSILFILQQCKWYFIRDINPYWYELTLKILLRLVLEYIYIYEACVHYWTSDAY